MKKSDVTKLYDARAQAMHILNGLVVPGADYDYSVEAIHRLINGCVQAHDCLYEAGKAFYEARTVT